MFLLKYSLELDPVTYLHVWNIKISLKEGSTDCYIHFYEITFNLYYKRHLLNDCIVTLLSCFSLSFYLYFLFLIVLHLVTTSILVDLLHRLEELCFFFHESKLNFSTVYIHSLLSLFLVPSPVNRANGMCFQRIGVYI